MQYTEVVAVSISVVVREGETAVMGELSWVIVSRGADDCGRQLR
jgi:hypothetical protein